MIILYYRSASGSTPVADYIDGLERPAQAAVIAVLRHIELHGLFDAPVAFRPIKGKLWELKIDAERIFYMLVSREEMVLLHAYRKKSQKAPAREIATAEKRMQAVLRWSDD